MNYSDYKDDLPSSSYATEERHLPENSVEYMLFVIDSKLEPRKRLAQLESIRQSTLQLSRKLTVDYIWQRQEFDLELRNQDGLTYLYGLTDYGDAVEDEWLIVHILREVTKTLPLIWARVADSDGEFLLIEAASVLPKWINPEIDGNRVWIHDNKLQIIPVNGKSSSSTNVLSLREAVQFLTLRPDALIHSPFIEAEAFYRLGKYPQQIEKSSHHSILRLPRKVAHILHILPRTVAPAVEAFYLRDPIVLKPLLAEEGELTFPPEDLVDISVRFSKVLFAQLRSQRFDAPSRWQPLVQKVQNSELDTKTCDTALTRLGIGMKLTCGFEILAAKAEKSQSKVVREMAIELEDIEEDGDVALPSDAEIANWADVNRDDDDSWMDINYQDFEKELGGGRSANSNQDGPEGFGDATTQADLKKIVSRFEAFLNDDSAGLDGAEMDEMDNDDDDDSEFVDDSEEDCEVGFDEDEFAKLMWQTMGLTPPSAVTVQETRTDSAAEQAVDQDSETDQDDVIQLASQFEKELRGHGALKLDAPQSGNTLEGKGKKAVSSDALEEMEENSDDEVDIDYNLAKNLLESFKSQGGVSGPTGNLLGMMGIQLPRDEDDGEEDMKK